MQQFLEAFLALLGKKTYPAEPKVMLITTALSLLVLALAIGIALKRRKPTGGKPFPFSRGIVSVALIAVSVFIYVFPLQMYVYLGDYQGESDLGAAFALALYETVRVFFVGADFNFVKDAVSISSDVLQSFCVIYGGLLYALAPMMTIGFVLSMFKDFWAQVRFMVPRYFRTTYYVFSELNERSLALATSICRQYHSPWDRWFGGAKTASLNAAQPVEQPTPYEAQGELLKSVQAQLAQVEKRLREATGDEKRDSLTVQRQQLLELEQAHRHILENAPQEVRVKYLKEEDRGAARKSSVNRRKPYFGKPIIVFTDVYVQNEERPYELTARARELGAICLKKDITTLNVHKWLNGVEFYVMGENESENLHHALHLVEQCNASHAMARRRVYIFARTETAAHIIDSAQRQELTELREQLKDGFAANREKFAKNVNDPGLIKANIQKMLQAHQRLSDERFMIRRVDDVQLLVQRTLRKAKLFESAKTTGKVCITVAGMGEYGRAFVKTALWFCQTEDYFLELNVIDESGDGEQRLWHECPELMARNGVSEAGEARYDMRIFSGVNCFDKTLDELLEGKKGFTAEDAARLGRTTHLFIALGDDDRNIEAAMMFRNRFDRLRGFRANKTAKPEEENLTIYAVVYDDQKAHNLNITENTKQTLINHEGIPYNIYFIGSMSEQYQYGFVHGDEEEQSAFAYHMDWAASEFAIRLAEARRQNATAVDLTYLDQLSDPEEAYQDIMKYEQYEYYRESSLAKMHHREASLDAMPKRLICHYVLPTETPERRRQVKPYVGCQCDNCQRRRRSEHMRWNAYMRSQGYVSGPRKATRGKVHADLKPFAELPLHEQLKD